MDFNKLPTNSQAIINLTWADLEPYASELESRPLSAASVEQWLLDWTALSDRVSEIYSRLSLATTLNTADEQADRMFKNYLDNVYPAAMSAGQILKEKLLASGLQPAGFEIPLRNMRAEADLFRTENLPLLSEQQKLNMNYDKIIGAQSVEWEGQEFTISRIKQKLHNPDRSQREKIWRAMLGRQIADRQNINDLWKKYMQIRASLAANAGKPSYREYIWQQYLRFDYTPQDCRSFHQAIEQVVVPAAKRIYERHRQQLGLDKLRPWDLSDGWFGRPVESGGQIPLKPFQSMDEFQKKAASIFDHVDPQLGQYFRFMQVEKLLDLDNRKNKAPGAYCTSFDVIRKPFVFMNAVGQHDDVQTLLHESGHAFHVFEASQLPYAQQLTVPMEFAEVASMGMELLAAPYLTRENGGYYTTAEAARARIEHLEGEILFWPFMAVVDAFQHWVYENPKTGSDPASCDAQWTELWLRFIPSVDWSGLDEELKTGWHRKLHIHQVPFYYVEYGLAQLGSVQIFANSIKDQARAVASYRQALSLGGKVTLPELFASAGGKFGFDVDTVQQAVTLMESTIESLGKK
ncbi:MAG: M3 family oligoendopeptidase [Chloroflexi bacterium GWB2_49_20]|nr:MAG: M3 family oligoendopeptidase [Chloroflexi bacterium GWB2_49_20]OGN78741.1 MAG: M3 family oligoendopeptidase [Chloroflexi bacterium GWC2_49_37]OGN85889.1 MAG: M3 family oligoendopeptidase [Chloroflexi bacterium GWD2_49_16]